MDDISEMYNENYYKNEFRYFHTVFLVPKDFTEEEVHAHSERYVESLRAEYDDTYVVLLSFYDSEIYYEYANNPVAIVCWSPFGRTDNMEDYTFVKGLLETIY